MHMDGAASTARRTSATSSSSSARLGAASRRAHCAKSRSGEKGSRIRASIGAALHRRSSRRHTAARAHSHGLIRACMAPSVSRSIGRATRSTRVASIPSPPYEKSTIASSALRTVMS